MNLASLQFRKLLLASAFCAASMACGLKAQDASFASFDRKAKDGERLNVVFFGCSLTWGANASDQIETSYRARVAAALEKEYPKAHFKCYDAAIGGTNSMLGAYRLDRDVLARKPDIVFVDFTLNDNAYTEDSEFNASYEAIVRRLILEAKCPVVQMFLCSEGYVKEKDLSKMKRRTAHYELSKAYGTGIGDAILEIKKAIESGKASYETVWPYSDKTHPGDLGYQLYADAAMAGLHEAIAEGKVCKAPEKMIWPDTYMHVLRYKLFVPDLELPQGWLKTHPSLTAAWHDALMTRWADGVIEAANMALPKGGKSEPLAPAQPLKIKFKGASSALLFGERNMNSGKLKITLDGKPLESVGKQKDGVLDMAGKAYGGNVYCSASLATKLNPDEDHELVLEPVFEGPERQVVRIESLCLAGPAPQASLVK